MPLYIRTVGLSVFCQRVCPTHIDLHYLVDTTAHNRHPLFRDKRIQFTNPLSFSIRVPFSLLKQSFVLSITERVWRQEKYAFSHRSHSTNRHLVHHRVSPLTQPVVIKKNRLVYIILQ